MYIDSLEVSEFRCFKNAQVSFQYRGKSKGTKRKPEPEFPNVNLILGDNGTGKTTILKGIVLGVLGTIIQSTGFRPYYLVRRNNEQTQTDKDSNADIRTKIKIHTSDLEVHATHWGDEIIGTLTGQAIITRRGDIETISSTAQVNPGKWRPLFDNKSPAFFVTAYGPSRRVESIDTFDPHLRERARAPRYQRIASIFEESTALTPFNVWLSESRGSKRYEEGIDIINKLLPDNATRIKKEIDLNDALFSVRNTNLPFSELSDGYRAFIGWVVDLLYQLGTVIDNAHNLTDVCGVVIVDELDLLLHPAWQRIIIEKLATAFPNIQFFFTTHSPILTGTLDSSNIIMTEINPETGEPSIIKSDEKVNGLSADQILNSRYFGLASSRSTSAERKLRDIANKAWGGDPEAASEYIRRLAEGF